MQLNQLNNGDLVIPLEGHVFDGYKVDLHGQFILSISDVRTNISMGIYTIINDYRKILNANNRNDWCEAFKLLGLSIRHCRVFNSGILFIELENNVKLEILPLPGVEHWEVSISTDPEYRMWSMPGAGYDWVCSSD